MNLYPTDLFRLPPELRQEVYRFHNYRNHKLFKNILDTLFPIDCSFGSEKLIQIYTQRVEKVNVLLNKFNLRTQVSLETTAGDRVCLKIQWDTDDSAPDLITNTFLFELLDLFASLLGAPYNINNECDFAASYNEKLIDMKFPVAIVPIGDKWRAVKLLGYRK